MVKKTIAWTYVYNHFLFSKPFSQCISLCWHPKQCKYSSEPCSLTCVCHSLSCNIVKPSHILEMVSEDLYRSANNFSRYLKLSQQGELLVNGRQSCAVLASFVPQKVNHGAKVKKNTTCYRATQHSTSSRLLKSVPLYAKQAMFAIICTH